MLDDRLCKHCPVGKHIVFRCKAHPEKTWHTKNMPGRTLFYNLYNNAEHGAECSCPGSLLYHDHERDGESTEYRLDPVQYVHVLDLLARKWTLPEAQVNPGHAPLRVAKHCHDVNLRLGIR